MGTKEPLAVLEDALKGGITAFQLREKGENALVGPALKEFAEKCKELCEEYNVPFIVNDDVELALEVGADGVHIGQEDGVITDVRAKIGSDKILGVSANTMKEALSAADAGANYIGIGPIYESKTKLDTKPVVGPELIKEVNKLIPGLPIVGIGGISERKASAVIGAGASGIAVISAITSEENTLEATKSIKGKVLLALTGVEM